MQCQDFPFLFEKGLKNHAIRTVGMLKWGAGSRIGSHWKKNTWSLRLASYHLSTSRREKVTWISLVTIHEVGIQRSISQSCLLILKPYISLISVCLHGFSDTGTTDVKRFWHFCKKGVQNVLRKHSPAPGIFFSGGVRAILRNFHRNHDKRNKLFYVGDWTIRHGKIYRNCPMGWNNSSWGEKIIKLRARVAGNEITRPGRPVCPVTVSSKMQPDWTKA